MANQLSPPLPVGARLAGDDVLETAIAGKPCSYRAGVVNKKECAVLATALVLVAALLHAAERALGAAKAGGHNRVEAALE